MNQPTMTEDEMQAILDDPEFQKKAFENLVSIFVTPEVMKRQEVGLLPKPLDLRAAQVLIYPDGRPVVVRINEEVQVMAEMRTKTGVSHKAGDPVYEHELEWIGNFRLIEDDDPNCGFIVLVKLHNQWLGSFSFIYNTAAAQQHLNVARQFFETAKFAADNKFWGVFVDTLFSASELAVKAFMMTVHPELRGAKKHTRLHSVFNRFANMGNVDPDFQKAFNKLCNLRPNGRYLEANVDFTDDEAAEVLQIVQRMIDQFERPIHTITAPLT